MLGAPAPALTARIVLVMQVLLLTGMPAHATATWMRLRLGWRRARACSSYVLFITCPGSSPSMQVHGAQKLASVGPEAAARNTQQMQHLLP
jgi:hypothetical protein